MQIYVFQGALHFVEDTAHRTGPLDPAVGVVLLRTRTSSNFEGKCRQIYRLRLLRIVDVDVDERDGSDFCSFDSCIGLCYNIRSTTSFGPESHDIGRSSSAHAMLFLFVQREEHDIPNKDIVVVIPAEVDVVIVCSNI